MKNPKYKNFKKLRPLEDVLLHADAYGKLVIVPIRSCFAYVPKTCNGEYRRGQEIQLPDNKTQKPFIKLPYFNAPQKNTVPLNKSEFHFNMSIATEYEI